MKKFDLEILRKTKEMVDKKIPYRTIGKELGVSIGFVGEVRHGRILMDGTRTKEAWKGVCRDSINLMDREYSKCEECGHMVMKPCLLCCIDKGDLESLNLLILTDKQQVDPNEPKEKYDDIYSLAFKRVQ